jgi:hypothetical protein
MGTVSSPQSVPVFPTGLAQMVVAKFEYLEIVASKHLPFSP